jgi:predicted transposase/invertase (TIGR01784 family)
VKQGVKQGIKQGVEQGILKTARAMQNEGMDVNTIARITGLTVDDVLKL